MILNTAQVTEKLGISKDSIRRLIKEGKLKDYGMTKENGKRHHYKFQSKEVNELAKSLSPKRKRVITREVKVEVLTTKPTGLFSRLNDLEETMAEINYKVDALLKIWS